MVEVSLTKIEAVHTITALKRQARLQEQQTDAYAAVMVLYDVIQKITEAVRKDQA